MNTAPNRHLPFQGTPNFRDFGGYNTADGRTVKWRKLFRSGHLAELTPHDQSQFESLDIRLLFDFRREIEIESEPNVLPLQAPPRVVCLPINPGSSVGIFERAVSGDVEDVDMGEFMCVVNREFVLEQGGRFKEMFANLLAQSEGGALVHCAAGKDRTGFAAAMTLAALGVPKSTIVEDYMLTGNYYIVDKEIDGIRQKAGWVGDLNGLRPLLEVRESYLQSAFDAIAENFSSLDHYLEDVLGLGQSERAELQGRYLD